MGEAEERVRQVGAAILDLLWADPDLAWGEVLAADRRDGWAIVVAGPGGEPILARGVSLAATELRSAWGFARSLYDVIAGARLGPPAPPG